MGLEENQAVMEEGWVDRRVWGVTDGSTQCQESEKSEEMAASVCREAETHTQATLF